MMTSLLHQKQKCEPMLDVMAEYDKHAEDLKQVDPLNLDLSLDQRREDYEKYKLNRVLSLATDITIGSVQMNDKLRSTYTGPRDALKYLAHCQQEGILIDDAKSKGAHLDTPGERDQREGIRGVYRKAQALSLDYERGRGLVVMTPVQANKTAEKIAAEPEPPMEKGIYRRGDIGAIEWHTDAGRDMDAIIGIWSGEDFAEQGLARISCIKSRQLFFAPFFMKIDEASQKMTYVSNGEALNIMSGADPLQTAAPAGVLMQEIADMAASL